MAGRWGRDYIMNVNFHTALEVTSHRHIELCNATLPVSSSNSSVHQIRLCFLDSARPEAIALHRLFLPASTLDLIQPHFRQQAFSKSRSPLVAGRSTAESRMSRPRLDGSAATERATAEIILVGLQSGFSLRANDSGRPQDTWSPEETEINDVLLPYREPNTISHTIMALVLLPIQYSAHTYKGTIPSIPIVPLPDSCAVSRSMFRSTN
ncbi:uncharacterized protein ARMOST_02660 [Armillaria ostoyae]|uniref:Uncharacterized protein n=1 Tax=Armillaria ostoyae TaxID=47428 RepID=A0A284QSC3_ARMOS|nr:uncharacterized protein ARMOST_02660 [Armillaria ostoyae]